MVGRTTNHEPRTTNHEPRTTNHVLDNDGVGFHARNQAHRVSARHAQQEERFSAAQALHDEFMQGLVSLIQGREEAPDMASFAVA